VTTEVARVTIDGAERPITINLAAGRIELAIDEHVAGISFRLAGERLAAAHTEVPDALRGKRIGDHLAHALLEYVRREGLKIEPFCPFVAAYIKRHAEYADLVASDFVG
jgi:predicted GNAT family acetyltransferase